MREVASKVFHIFFRPLAAKGVALDSMVEGTSVSLATLQRRNERIDWSDLCAIHRNLRRHFNDEELVEVETLGELDTLIRRVIAGKEDP